MAGAPGAIGAVEAEKSRCTIAQVESSATSNTHNADPESSRLLLDLQAVLRSEHFLCASGHILCAGSPSRATEAEYCRTAVAELRAARPGSDLQREAASFLDRAICLLTGCMRNPGAAGHDGPERRTGVAASAMATDVISALAQAAVQCPQLIPQVLAALTALCRSAIGRIGLPGNWVGAFGELFAAVQAWTQWQDGCTVATGVELLAALDCEGGLQLLVIHARPVLAILAAAARPELLPSSELVRQVVNTVVQMAGHGGAELLLRENVLSVTELLLDPTRTTPTVRWELQARLK